MTLARGFAGVLLFGLVACAGQTPSTPTPAAPVATSQVGQPVATLSPEATGTSGGATAVTAGETTAPLETTGAGQGSFTLQLQPVVTDLDQPVHVTHAGDGSGRLFVAEKAGTIRIVANNESRPEPFLDITNLVGSSGSEQGLFSVAFHPDFRANGRFFVDYTDKSGDTVIARYQVSSEPDVADPASAVTLLIIDQPYPNHNGGQLAFGPDGYLYIGMGDGGSGGDPQGNGQNTSVLLGKLLRIDVNTEGEQPYGIPTDNPFVGQSDARPEVWAIGLRNPWRFSFDRETGDLFIADVGQGDYEEVNVHPASAGGGKNYGWNRMEGLHCFNPKSGCDRQGLELPVAEYDHSQGCSVTGGMRYRGTAAPAFGSTYFYGDYCSGTIWGLSEAPGGTWRSTELLASGHSISSFGEDEAGEIYMTDLSDGGVYRLVAAR